MLKGHVFSKQLFKNTIFALFINTFLNGKNGISSNYKNAMKVTYSNSNITIASGAVCIQGRFLEEDTSTSLTTGTDTAYCKLVIEINLDKENTESELNQASYKIIKSTSAYPNLTQTNILKNNSGIYQYELARFRTSTSGISEFQDKRTFLDFDSIYDKIQQEYRTILEQLKQELSNVKNGSAYVLKDAYYGELLFSKDVNTQYENFDFQKQLRSNVKYIIIEHASWNGVFKSTRIDSPLGKKVCLESPFFPNEGTYRTGINEIQIKETGIDFLTNAFLDQTGYFEKTMVSGIKKVVAYY